MLTPTSNGRYGSRDPRRTIVTSVVPIPGVLLNGTGDITGDGMTRREPCLRCEHGRMLSHQQAATILNMSVETVHRLLASGDLATSVYGGSLVDSVSVEAFRVAERKRVGQVMQAMVTDAEDMGLYDVEPLPFKR